MRRTGPVFALAMVIALAWVGPAASRDPDAGVTIGRGSIARYAYPASLLENSAMQQFTALKQQAGAKGALLPPDHPQNVRLRRIARDMLPFIEKWNPRAKEWKWEVVTIKSSTVNAFCMPGGKIAFFTGILDRLNLTDDEVAMIMGHEMAHALREHGRARAVKTTLTNVTSRVIGALILGDSGQVIGQQAAGLFNLRFSRGDETDADLVGMELAARAGYNPASGVKLWEKMASVSKGAGKDGKGAEKGAPPEWLSTHPANTTRIKTIKDHLHEVEGIYQRAHAAKLAKGKPVIEPEAPAGSPPGRITAPPGPPPGAPFPQQQPLPVPR